MTDGERAAFALCSSYIKGLTWEDNQDSETIKKLTIHFIPLNTDEVHAFTFVGIFSGYSDDEQAGDFSPRKEPGPIKKPFR